MSLPPFLLIFVSGVFAAADIEPTTNAIPDTMALYRAQQVVFREAMNRVAPSVVTIETIGGTQPLAPVPTTRPTEKPEPGKPQGRRPVSPGAAFIVAEGPTTGLIWTSDGLILTSSFNFVRDPSVITVTLADGRRFVGELLARDEVRKLAMVRIQAAGLPVPDWVTRPADIRVGQWSLALGRGFGGLQCGISAGIISGLNRQSGLAVQTDAKLSPANYGGPLINIEGRVIGLCVPMGMTQGEMAGVELYDSGLGFVVPHAQAALSAKDLAVGHNLRRGLLGVAIDPRLPTKVVVSGVADPSPARNAGIRVSDQITAIDEQPVEILADLRRVLAARLAGEWIKIRLRRDGRDLDLELILAVPEDLGPLPQQAPPAPVDMPGDDHPPDEEEP